MNKLQVIESIRLKELDGEILLNLEDVSRELGFTRTANSGNEVVRWSRVNGYISDVLSYPFDGHANTMISESTFYLLAMKGNNKKCQAFQIKVATEKDKRVVQQMLSEALWDKNDRLDLIPNWGRR